MPAAVCRVRACFSSGARPLERETFRRPGEGTGLERRIKLIVSDVEGCVVPGNGRAWDLNAVGALARYNRLARESGGLPPLTLLSGRPVQYVEALGQAIGLYAPAGCENGAMLFFPGEGRVEPQFDAGQAAMMAAVRRALGEGFVRDGQARLAVGKEACVSLVPVADGGAAVTAELCRRVADFLAARLGLTESDLHFTFSSGAVDITPAGIDKGHGVRALARACGCTPEEVLGIGDSANDLPFLAAVGVACAPANALPEVRARAAYVSDRAWGAGVLDIVRRFTGADLERGGRAGKGRWG